jgi:hypothetical protein
LIVTYNISYHFVILIKKGVDLDKDNCLALDLLWTDVCPSELDPELSTQESSGFGCNDSRGPNIKVIIIILLLLLLLLFVKFMRIIDLLLDVWIESTEYILSKYRLYSYYTRSSTPTARYVILILNIVLDRLY